MLDAASRVRRYHDAKFALKDSHFDAPMEPAADQDASVSTAWLRGE
jgi:hypothetical protein